MNTLTLNEFENNCIKYKIDDGWYYWNWLLPQTAPQYFVWMILKFIDSLKELDK